MRCFQNVTFIRAISLTTVSAVAVAGCSAGGSRSQTPIAVIATNANAGPLVSSTLSIVIPFAPQTAAGAVRRPEYVSANTAKISVTLASPPTGFIQPGALSITLGGTNADGVACPTASGGYDCTIPLHLPPRSDTLTVTALDSSSNILSTDVATFQIVAGTSNTPSLTLDAQVGSQACASPAILVTVGSGQGTGSACSGTSQGTIVLPNATTAQTLAVTLHDASGLSIAPTVAGAPTLSAGQTGGGVTVSASSNPYSVTLTPATAGGSSTVTLTASGLNAGDGVALRTIAFSVTVPSKANGGVVSTIAGVVGKSTPVVNGSAASATFSGPESVAVDSSGNIYIADTDNNLIRKISGGQVTTLAGNGNVGSTNGPGASAEFNTPSGIAVNAAGDVFVADSGNDVIREIDTTGTVSTYAGVVATASLINGAAATATFNDPLDVKADPSGNLFVADSGNDVIREISTAKVVSTYAGNTTIGFRNGSAASAEFSNIQGVGTDPLGNVYVADEGNFAVREIAGGMVTTLAGTGTAGFNNGNAASATFGGPGQGPEGVTGDASGNVYVADDGNNVIRKIAAGVVTTFAGSPTGVAGSANGTGTSASFNAPIDVIVDSSGRVFVVDTGNDTIREIQ